jgi:hypothetical protein
VVSVARQLEAEAVEHYAALARGELTELSVKRQAGAVRRRLAPLDDCCGCGGSASVAGEGWFVGSGVGSASGGGCGDNSGAHVRSTPAIGGQWG